MGTRTDDVYVWNATGVRLSLAGITETLFGGLSLATTGQPSPPCNMPLNAEWHYVLTETLAGPASIIAEADWTFIEGYIAPLSITGERVMVMPYRHNWASPLLERLQWLTDIMVAENGTEQRVSHRAYPRRSWEYRLLLQNDIASAFETRGFAWQALPYTVPIWRDWQPLAADLAAGASTIPCTTANKSFVAGAPALLWASETNYEAVQVASVSANQITTVAPTQNAWPKGTRLIPMRSARLLQALAMQRATANIMEAVVDWDEDPGVNEGDLGSISLPTYQGFPVYLVPPERSRPSNRSFTRAWYLIDGTPGIRAVYPKGTYPQDQWDFTWLLQGWNDIASLRGLLSMMKGRLNPVWFPTWQRDFILAAALGSTDTNIVVNDVGYSLYVQQHPMRRDLYIRLNDGTYFLRRITASSRGNGTETLTLDSALGRAVSPSDVLIISFLDLRRLDQDQVEFAWLTDQVVRVTVQTMAVMA
jgi:hypothetical protein